VRLEPPALPPADLLLVLAQAGGEFRLGQPEAPADGPEPSGKGLGKRLGVVPDEGNDRCCVPDGSFLAALPVAHGYLGHFELVRKVALPQAKLESAPPDAFAEVARHGRVTLGTSWGLGRVSRNRDTAAVPR
jgi:hypothetical protein